MIDLVLIFKMTNNHFYDNHKYHKYSLMKIINNELCYLIIQEKIIQHKLTLIEY